MGKSGHGSDCEATTSKTRSSGELSRDFRLDGSVTCVRRDKPCSLANGVRLSKRRVRIPWRCLSDPLGQYEGPEVRDEIERVAIHPVARFRIRRTRDHYDHVCSSDGQAEH